MKIFKDKNVKNALVIGIICSISYLACYFARNILSVISPQLVEATKDTIKISFKYIGTLSTANMYCYAIGQLINGIIGDKVKGKYMVGLGLTLSGICGIIFGLAGSKIVMLISYGLIGFFLSMLYAPLTKLIAENTHPKHAVKCCLGLTFASLFGTPVAGAVALIFEWDMAFVVCGIILLCVGIGFMLCVTMLEKKGIVTYKVKARADKKKGSIKVLIEHEIIRFSFVSILTGIVRTSVVFWVPTYLSDCLKFSPETATIIFTAMTIVQSISPYVNNIIIYELILKRNMNRMLLLAFSMSTVSFILMLLTIKIPFVNIVFLAIALITANGASDMLWSIYCPSLRDTGMVSSATGYLDFLSYMAAASANILFANAISAGWNKLILVWAGLMLGGVVIALPWRKLLSRR